MDLGFQGTGDVRYHRPDLGWGGAEYGGVEQPF